MGNPGMGPLLANILVGFEEKKPQDCGWHAAGVVRKTQPRPAGVQRTSALNDASWSAGVGQAGVCSSTVAYEKYGPIVLVLWYAHSAFVDVL